MDRHGRDSHLRVWSLDGIDDAEAGFSQSLPVDGTSVERKDPWLLHSLTISTLNFCPFAGLSVPSPPSQATSAEGKSGEHDEEASGYLIAVPGHKDSDVELYHLPSERQVGLIPPPVAQAGQKAGMVMALSLCRRPDPSAKELLHVAVGYESGRTCLFRQVNTKASGKGSWEMLYSARPHEQPILGLDVLDAGAVFFTSAADAIVARHTPVYDREDLVEEVGGETQGGECKIFKTGHSSQQALRVRSDGRIFATAGWDGRVRVYGVRSAKEVAVLKFHKEAAYAVEFAAVGGVSDDGAEIDGKKIERAYKTVAQQRAQKVRETHWVVTAGKDGRIASWDIY